MSDARETGEVDLVLTGTAQDLAVLVAGEENPAVLLRAGRIRHVSAEGDLPTAEVSQVMRALTEISGHTRLSTIQAEFLDWVKPSASWAVSLEMDAIGRRRFRWQGSGPRPKTYECKRRIWFSRPDRLRVEVLELGDELVRIGVRDGVEWWRWDDDEGAINGNIERDGIFSLPGMLDPPLLAPSRFLASLWLEPVGEGVRAEREVVCARAWPRRVVCARAWPRRAPPRAQVAYELEFDREHDTLLRRAAFEDGRCFRLLEASHVAYERRIAAERFALEIPKTRKGNGASERDGTEAHET